MSWIDDQHAKHAAEIAAKYPKIEPGMFVQLTTWFGDVYAEILDSYRSDDKATYSSVDFVQYGKYGKYRRVNHSSFYNVRKIITAEELAAIPGYKIVYTKKTYQGAGGFVEWPTEIKRQQYQDEYRPT